MISVSGQKLPEADEVIRISARKKNARIQIIGGCVSLRHFHGTRRFE